jgi:ParB family transcriptional regulator, chromosome partitioning protein
VWRDGLDAQDLDAEDQGRSLVMTANPQKKRLVRGLADMMGFDPDAAEAEGQRTVALSALKAGRFNPRRNFPEAQLEELAVSIREKGLVQPLVVRPSGEAGTYEIVAGERRWRAAQLAHLHEVPVVVRALSDQEAVEIAIIENVQREDLNAIEEGEGYKLLMDGHGYTQEDLSKVIGKSRSHLANTLRLLKLPDSVQELVRSGELSAGHARALIGRADAAALAARIVKEGLTVRDVEALTQDRGPDKPKRQKSKDADTKAAEAELSEALGLKVEIKRGKKEKGELRVRYATFDQLEDLRHRLMRRPSR